MSTTSHSEQKPVPVPAVSMIEAFTPSADVGSEQLAYPNLERVAYDAARRETAHFNEVLRAEPGSLAEEKAARKAALTYLVLTGAQLNKPGNTDHQLWTNRLTRSSVELYGSPDTAVAKQLIAEQFDTFSEHRTNPAVDQARLGHVLDTLSHALGDTSSESIARVDYAPVARELAAVAEQKYQTAFSVFEGVAGPEKQNLETVQALFQRGLDALATDDPAWQGWTAEIVNGSGMSTSSRDKKIKIGNGGTYTADRLKPLFAHEALVHGLRSVNGSKTGDTLLATGLPGNLDAEEGLGTLVEYGLTGTMPERNADRYMDVALALGSTESSALTRAQLHRLHTDRQIIRAQAAGKQVDPETIAKGAWGHVNRIYRGSLGDDTIGVNTKDIAYYQGFQKVADFLRTALANGVAPETAYDYVMSGCFDPTDPKHRAYLAEKTSR